MKKAVIFFIISFFIYLATSGGHTPYNYFTRLADAFLQGRLYLTTGPSWLSELLELSSGKYFVVYPPMPAIVAIPFVSLFGSEFPQEYLAHLTGAITVAFSVLISYKIKKSKDLAVWVGILTGFGSILWYLSATGSVWYLGQTTAACFMTLAIYESITRKRPLLVGIILSASYLSRLPTVFIAPLLYVLINTESIFETKNFSSFLKEMLARKAITKGIYLVLGFLPLFIFDSWYNYVRFGVPWDNAYFLLPKALNETDAPWFKYGVMNVRYIPENIKTAFLSLPKFLDTVPYIQPSWYGLSILITTPAFLFSLKTIKTNWVTKISWITILTIFLFDAMHGGTGWAQFGYRFAVDFYPVIIFLTAIALSTSKLRCYHWLLLFLCVLVNLWGVLWINKFGWVGF